MERYSILIADDDPSVREALRDTLDREGYDTLTASCGKEAIELVNRRRRAVHASILDMFMPDLTGLETLAMLFRLVDDLPTIILTADESKELLTKAMEAGAFTLLRKPVSSGLILVTLNQLLGRYYGDPRQRERGDRRERNRD
jgi:two-component system response regulator MprA